MSATGGDKCHGDRSSLFAIRYSLWLLPALRIGVVRRAWIVRRFSAAIRGTLRTGAGFQPAALLSNSALGCARGHRVAGGIAENPSAQVMLLGGRPKKGGVDRKPRV